MKKPHFVIFALYLSALLASCGSAPQTEAGAASRPAEAPKGPLFDGDGGRDITLAVLEPAADGLKTEEQYLTRFVQGVLTSDLNRVTAMKIIDRQNLDRVIAEQVVAAGVTKDNTVKIGETTGADFVLTGELIKIRTGGYSLQLAVTELATNERKASHTAATTAVGIERSAAVKDAAADLLSQLDIHLTEAGRNLLYGTGEKTVAAETALAKGLTAQRAASTPKTTVEALSYLYEARSLDPLLLEAADRLAAYQAAVFTAPEVTIPELAAPVYTGNIGADARNEIARWKAQGEAIRQQQQYLLDQRAVLLRQQKTLLDRQGELIGLLRETENFYAAHPPFEIIYDPRVEQDGAVDPRKETVNLRFPLMTMSTASLGVMKNILEGLDSMKQGFGSINSGLDKIQEQIDRVNAAGKEYDVEPVAGIRAADRNNGASYSPGRWISGDGRTFAVQAVLTNDRGKQIGTAAVTLKNEITGSEYILPANANGYCVFQNVGVNDITDTLRISINRVNAVALDDTDNAGYIRISALDASGHTEDGYDINGYRDGYDRSGYDRLGYDRTGYDHEGWGKDGYNKDRSSSKYQIGMVGPGGGYIFYDKGTFSGGWRFLEAAPESAEFMAEADDAEERCEDISINGLTGWRLPDQDELNLMYINLKRNGLGGFKNAEYWSSSSYFFSLVVWYQDFSNGRQGDHDWDVTYSARAVRAF